MDTKSIKIIPPEGMEAYQDGNEIKFRPVKNHNLPEVYKKLFANEDVWRLDIFGSVSKYYIGSSPIIPAKELVKCSGYFIE